MSEKEFEYFDEKKIASIEGDEREKSGGGVSASRERGGGKGQGDGTLG